MIDDLENPSGLMTITKVGKIDFSESPADFDAHDLPILPTRNLILFPEVTAHIGILRESSRLLAEAASRNNTVVGVICQKDAEVETPSLKDLEKYGVLARIINVVTLPNGAHTAIIKALGKFRVVSAGKSAANLQAPLTASVKIIKDIMPRANDAEFEAMVKGIKDLTLSIIGKSAEGFCFELGMNLNNIDDPLLIINTVATMYPLEHQLKLRLLTLHRVKDRAFELLAELTQQDQMADLTEKIKDKARMGMNQHQRDAFLREQMEAIREELYGEEADDVEKLEKRATKKKFNAETRELVKKEIEKLGRLNPQSPDYSVQYNFLDLLLSLPWNEPRPTSTNFREAEEILEASHYGLEKVKDRILEQLAVILNNPDVKSPIICLVGPPGVGKTSIARAVAEALGRDYHRVSLGGVHDEAEIRGHRRTYIGAMPGRIIDAMKRVDSSNPVLVLDEIDKLGNDYKGDPSSALLEVLDPEQNSRFHDNYVDIDFDLSKVLFIATANTLSTLSQPLIDRMEVIELSGYALEEKVEIANRHIIGKVKKEISYDLPAVQFTPEALQVIIDEYTSESGVRQMEKKIASVLRKHLKKRMKGEPVDDVITTVAVREFLGVSHGAKEKYAGNDYPGVVTGLAWTAAGGDILFIESSLIPGKGDKLTLTGNLGDVMKESATLALQYVKANSVKLGIDKDVFENNNIHVHVPEGAVPKDGPSAGITLVTSLVSAIKGVKVAPRVAMTGEITLRGKVLPVGGIKEKMLAAKRAGIETIILSEENRKDVAEIPERYIDGLEFKFVKDISEVLSLALTDENAA